MKTASAAAALAFVLAACSGGAKEPAGTFAVPSSTRSSGVPTAVTTVSAERLRPPAPPRLFAGTRSVLGQLIRYCKGSSCTEPAARAPASVSAPPGAFLLFTMGEVPLEAIAEVRVRAGDRPGTVRLSPGTVMTFDPGVGAGRWIVDLVVRWRSAEARWRFGLTVTS